MRLMGSVVAGMLAVGTAMTSSAAGPESAGAGCGHEAELVAAKRALELGDQEAALRHLKSADALLERCMRRGTPATPRGEDEAAETRAG